jgi:transcriptional regulator with XRE-family HTH domain
MMRGRPLKAVDPDASAAAKLGADLRALRVERELTLTQLGDKIGFSTQYISGAELARTTVSARFVAACDRVLGADGALVALLPDVVWEKELRRQQRSNARARLAPSLRPASGHGEGGDDVNPTSRHGLVDAGASAALGLGTAVAPAAGRAIDPALPGHLKSLLAILGAHDAAYGPRDVLGTVRRELQVIARDREVARGDLRTDLMRVEARWTIYAAWLCEDTADSRGRVALLDRAVQMAREADHPDLMAWARARQAQWTDPPRAIRLAEAALRTPRAGAHTRALCAVRAAYAHARIADADTTARLLAEAHELAVQQSASPPLPADTPLSGFLVRCWEARCWALLEPAEGVALYDSLLRDWPHAVGRRDRSLYQARLAIACAASRQLDRARAEGRKALMTARATQSATAARELRQLHDLLRS